jgi:hypothetical protein
VLNIEHRIVYGAAAARPWFSLISIWRFELMKFRNRTPAERALQLEAKLKSITWKEWQVPTAGQFEIYYQAWKEYLAARPKTEA